MKQFLKSTVFFNVSTISLVFLIEKLSYSAGFIPGIGASFILSIVIFLLTRKRTNPETPLIRLLPIISASFMLIHKTTIVSPSLYEPYYHGMFAHTVDNNLYGYLADALLQGRVSLNLPVPQELANLSNPYDFAARYSIAINDNVKIYFDYAFFDGKYYSYFGVLPAIFLYMPFRLITGSMLNTPAAIEILALVYLSIAALFSLRFAQRYYRHTFSSMTLSLNYLLLIACSGVFYLGFVSRVYSVPILTSMSLSLLALWFWLGARREDNSSSRLSPLHLACGSALSAMNLGARPQFLLVCLFAFPIFWREIAEERILFSKKGFFNTFISIASAILVLIPLLWYNYIRFNSIFNLGSSYNLTGFDMTHYAQSWKTTLKCLFYYLFQPFNLDSSFPFIHTTEVVFDNGPAPIEPMFGGIFFLVPPLLLLLLFPKVYEDIKARALLFFCALAFLFSCLVLIVDARQAGVTQRYYSDFCWYLALITSVILYSLEAENASSRHVRKNRVVSFAIVFTITGLLISVFVGGASFLAPDRIDSISTMNPVLYEKLMSIPDLMEQ